MTVKKTLSALFAVIMLVGVISGCGGDKNLANRGAWDGTTYKNAYLGLQMTMPSGFTALTDDEIVAAYPDDSNVLAGLPGASQYSWYTRIANSNGSWLSIGIHNYAIAENVYLNWMTNRYTTNANLDVTINGRTTKTIAGKEYAVLHYSIIEREQGVDITDENVRYEQYHFIDSTTGEGYQKRRIDVTVFAGDNIDTIMASFSAYSE